MRIKTHFAWALKTSCIVNQLLLLLIIISKLNLESCNSFMCLMSLISSLIFI